MTWGVNQIQLVNLAIVGLVLQSGGLRFNGDAALTLYVHGVEHLRFHLTISQAATQMNDAIGQGGFTVINVGNNGKITNVFHLIFKLLYKQLRRQKRLFTIAVILQQMPD